MNIFAVDMDPKSAAEQLPDRHVTKMILETAQMLSIVFSPHYWDIGKVLKVDGTPFKTEKGAFKKHPCTMWAAEKTSHCAWLIQHGCSLTVEFVNRYGHQHKLTQSLFDCKKLFQRETGKCILDYLWVERFARAMPDDLKYDESISDVEAYQRYLNTKDWVYYNYLRLPGRRPSWLLDPSLS